jgi:AcrR family transcriptional regulator
VVVFASEEGARAAPAQHLESQVYGCCCALAPHLLKRRGGHAAPIRARQLPAGFERQARLATNQAPEFVITIEQAAVARKAGVSTEETRQQVVVGAAAVFAKKGYDGASIAEIATEARVSSGAIYAHFGSKAQLFAATLHARGPAELEELLGRRAPDPAAVFHDRGLDLARRRPERGFLLIEAIVAARRHPDVAALLQSEFVEREERIAALIRAGQRDGTVDQRVRASAVARFLTMLSLGSLLATAVDLPPVDEDDWVALMDHLHGRFNPRSTPTKRKR